MAIPHHEAPPPTPRRRLLRPPGLYGLFAACIIAVLVLAGLAWFQTVGGTERVPKLVGLSEEDARLQADKLGLKVKVGSLRYDSSVPKDKVAQVQPGVGTQVKTGTLLTLVVSTGKRPVAVPDVVNKPLDQAKQQLQQAGLQPGEQLRQDSTTVQRGYVITTRPPAGKKQNPDEPITIVVSSGMTMPDLSNLKPDQAAQKLATLGLNVQWQEQDPATGQQPNTVIGQSPPAGQPVNRGDNVQVAVTNQGQGQGQGQCQWNPFCTNGDNGNNGNGGNG
jgi:serine/threonine-protein kinase